MSLRRAHGIPSVPVPAQLRLPRRLARRKAPRKYQNKRQARCVYSSPSRLFEPILRFRRYVFLLRSTISPGRGFTGPPPFSGLPPSLTRTHALLRFAVLALACKPAARLPALRFPAVLGRPGQTLRGLPVRRAKAPPGPWQVSGSPVASPFSGTIPAAAHSLLRLGTGPSRPWLGRSPGQQSTGLLSLSGSPTGPLP